MNKTKALKKIEYYSPVLAKAEILWLIDNYEEVRADLFKFINAAPKTENEDFNGHIPAMYIMAQKKDTDAFKPLLNYLGFGMDKLEYLMGDCLLCDFPAILADVMPKGAQQELEEVVFNKSYDMFVRIAAMDALVKCYFQGKVSRKYIIDILRRVITLPALTNNDIGFIENGICFALDICANELYDISKLFFENHVNRPENADFVVVDKEEIEELKKPFDEEKLFEQRSKSSSVDNAVKWLKQWYDTDDVIISKCGRNDDKVQ